MARNRSKAENSIEESEGQTPDNPQTIPPVDTAEGDPGEEGSDEEETADSLVGGAPVAPPLTGEERLRLAEAKIDHLYEVIHGLASHTFTSAEAKAVWLKDHFHPRAVDGNG